MRSLFTHNFVLGGHASASARGSEQGCGRNTRSLLGVQYADENLTGGWVVLQSEVDVFLDTKAKAAGIGEVLALELVLLHLKPSLKDLQRLIAADLRIKKVSTELTSGPGSPAER